MLSKQHHGHQQQHSDGHAVQPVLLRESSAVESIVATIRPLAAGSTRRIEQQYRRISEGISYFANTRNTSYTATSASQTSSPAQLPDVDTHENDGSDSEPDDNVGRTGQPDLAASIAGSPSGCASKDGANNLVWSSWDVLPHSATITGQPEDIGGRRVLITVYTAGMSIWDIQDTNEAKEIFNLSRSPVNSGHVTCARVVPSLRNRDATQTGILTDFPLLAILTSDSTISFYSLSSHKIVRSLRISGNVADIQLNEGYLLAATVEPAALRVYSLQTVTEESFSPISDVAAHPKTGIPVYTLSRSRLLAYASTSSLPENSGNGIISAQSHSDNSARASSRRDGPSTDSDAQRPSSIPIQISSETARKVGEGMLSGMKAITDYGYARYRSSRGSSPTSQAGLSPNSGGTRFSRSAPQPSHLARQADYSHRENQPPYTGSKGQRSSTSTVIVVDLVSTSQKQYKVSGLTRNNTQSRRIAHFKPSKSHPITLLSFNPSGTQILTSSSEGHAFHIFELRPSSLIGSSRVRAPSTQAEDRKVWHRYRLNRGLTPADAVQAVWSADSRFVSVTTSRGTAHIFPLLPGGGKPGIETHLSDRIVNMAKLMPLSVSVSALVRIKPPQPLPEPSGASKGINADTQNVDDEATAAARPAEPPLILFMPSGDILHSLRSTSSKSSYSVNIFGFYPHLSNLVYSRIALSSSPKTAPASAPLTNRVTSQAASGITQMMRSGGSLPTTFESEQLLARESKVAYYPLGRGEDWKDVLLDVSKLSIGRAALIRRATSAHQAEIETFSRSRAVLPRSIYLSPTFTFHHYPPSAQPSNSHPLIKAFSLGNFSLPASSKRLVVRTEVYHTHRYPLSEAAEGEELRSAMHTILDSASYTSTTRKRITDQNASDPDDAFLDTDPANSPAFPNGYGKTSSPSASSTSAGNKGWGVPLALPIPILPRGMPIKATTQSLTRSMERMSKHFSGTSSNSPSPRLSASTRSDRQQATSLSFEDEDAVFALPAQASYTEGKRRGSFALSKELYDVAENETAYGSSSVPPLSIDAGSSAESRSEADAGENHGDATGLSLGVHAASDMVTEGKDLQCDEQQPSEGRDEWEAWKLDGIDEEELPPHVEPSKTLIQSNLPLAVPSVIEASKELDSQLPERTVPLTKAELLLGVSPSSSSNASSYEAGGMLQPSRPTSALEASPASSGSAGSGNRKKNRKNGRK